MPVVSYGLRLRGKRTTLDSTCKIYRSAVNYLINIVLMHYNELVAIESEPDGISVSKLRQSAIEKLVHTTEKNQAKYKGFDKKFYKFPSYFRRDAITTAIGKVFAYKSLVKNWEIAGCKGKKPFFNRTQDVSPCFYRTIMFDRDSIVVNLKVYDAVCCDWIWEAYLIRDTDNKYVEKNLSDWKSLAPVLVRKHGGYELRSAFVLSAEKFPAFTKDKDVTVAAGVDLGINTDAVCSVIRKDGTVIGQKFINSLVEKDRLDGLLNCVKKAQQHGNKKNYRLWRFINNYNKAVAIRTAVDIVDFARASGAQVIVFEHLSFKGKIRGSRKQRIALWRKREIQQRVEALAARSGIRVSYICAKNTSKFAFDGSGKVLRGKEADFPNNKLCKFRNGKIYNCDLSASRNIVARYFTHVLKKSVSAKKLLQAQAKVSGLCRRTSHILSTLISLYAELYPPKAACDIA